MFGGGNYDSDDLDEWLTLQRDWQVDAGIEPLDEESAIAVRLRAARAVQAVFDVLGFPPISEEEVRLAATCLDSRDLPDRDRGGDVLAGDRVLTERISGLDVARALAERGFADVADAVFGMQRQKVAADYLQTSAIIAADGTVVSAVNDANSYAGPGTGYRLEGERWRRLQQLPYTIDARLLGSAQGGEPSVEEVGEAFRGTRADEVVVALGPAVGDVLSETINGLQHRDVLAALVEGVRDEGAEPRLVRIRRSSDVAFIGHDGARLSGSGIAVGLQSKGTALIHRADLEPLDNLELFGMAPSLTLDSYRQIGRNAAGYALGRPVAPVPTVMDNYARAKLIVRTTLLHARETAAIVRGGAPVELELVAAPAGADTVYLSGHTKPA
jgi:propanediol dehydratase large subunit